MTRLNNFLTRMHKEAALLFLLVIGIGITLACITPIGWNHDESVHAFKAQSLSRGHLFSQEIGPWHTPSGTPITVYGDYTSASLIELEAAAQELKSELANNKECLLQDRVSECVSSKALFSYNNAAQQSIQSEPVLTDFWGVNANTPVGYIPSAIGFGAAHLTHSSAEAAVKWGRIGNVFAGAILATLAFLLVATTRFRWVIFAIALAPFVLLSFSSLGGDGPLIALSLVLVACYYRLLTQKRASKTVTILTVVTAVAIPLIKLPYLLLSLVALFLPVFNKSKYLILFRFLLGVGVIIPGLLWNMAVKDATRTQYLLVNAGPTPPDATGQLLHILQHPFDTIVLFTTSIFTETIGSLNSPLQISFASPALLTTLIPCILIVVAALYAHTDKKQTHRQQNKYLLPLVLALTNAGVIVGIALMMYLNYNSVGALSLEGFQGRYLLPLLAPLALLLALWVRVTIKGVESREKYSFITLVCVLALCAPLWVIGIVY